MSNGLAIELEENFAWMEDSVLVYTTHGCKVIQQGENIEGDDDYFIVLEFYKTKCVRSVATDCSPSIGIYPETKSVSFIAELHNSNWDDEAHKKYTYGGTPKYTDRKHYVVSNHDVFHEILAESFSEKKISHTNTDYEITKNIYLYAKAQIV